ncbi:hypothetical protein [Leptospira neocaledonica]|uniref:YokE-like PH domain-containing protein n=1 Tax=Leptospira neocaledonica TaxID=2023192 RepID=A0A2M9ZUF8_9LEPT|nr:hypothetical protein [Leptospira neocaledonica]PJZ75675.1 hypothetical protein CH365_18220 [Leptospira neocaledonica]
MNHSIEESARKRIEREAKSLIKYGYGTVCSEKENELGLCLFHYKQKDKSLYLRTRGLEWGSEKVFFKEIEKVGFASLKEITLLGAKAARKEMDIELSMQNGNRIKLTFPFPVFSILATLLHQLAELSKSSPENHK